MNTSFRTKIWNVSSLSLLALSLAACGGGSGGNSKTFAALNDVRGSYHSSSITCKGDEALDAAFEAEVIARAEKDGGVMTLTGNSMGGSFPVEDIKCSFVINTSIVKATTSELTWKDFKVSYQGPECDKIPAEGRELIKAMTEKAPKSGAMKIRYTPKILLTIDKADGECDAFVRIK